VDESKCIVTLKVVDEDSLRKLAVALNVTIDYLLVRSDNTTTHDDEKSDCEQ